MTADEIATAYTALPPGEQAEVLAHLAHELTILARDCYVPGGDGLTDPTRMRAINEVQHTVAGHLVHLLQAGPARYPDDVLVHILLDTPLDPPLSAQVAWTFGRSLGWVAQPA